LHGCNVVGLRSDCAARCAFTIRLSDSLTVTQLFSAYLVPGETWSSTVAYRIRASDRPAQAAAALRGQARGFVRFRHVTDANTR